MYVLTKLIAMYVNYIATYPELTAQVPLIVIKNLLISIYECAMQDDPILKY